MTSAASVSGSPGGVPRVLGGADWFARWFAGSVVVTAICFLFNNYLTFWLEWPGALELLAQQGWVGLEPQQEQLSAAQVTQGWLQLGIYLLGMVMMALFVLRSPQRPLRVDAQLWSSVAAYIVRSAFWMVLIIGMADMLISLLRVEEILSALVGDEIARDLAKPQYRGEMVHYPLMAMALVIALFQRSLGFTWLALLVVIAEFAIVILRFVFSYEQAFMGDLVRFWYAALFLFASAHTLLSDGHVRVDVLYAHFSRKARAWSNAAGLLLLGLPFCWIILSLGMWGKASSINSPLLSFEVSQSGYGMYVKYLMVGFLVVFALSMIVQFSSALLNCVADLRDEPGGEEPLSDVAAH